MLTMKASLLVCLVGLAGLRVGLAADITWETDANMDRQLFPALIIATATQRPQDDEDTKPDPEVLGDEYGAVGVSLKAPKAGTKVQVTLKENAVMNASSWSGTLEKAGT